MNNYQYSGCRNHSKEEESVFFIGILWIKEHASARIIENALSFFKPDAMVARYILDRQGHCGCARKSHGRETPVALVSTFRWRFGRAAS
jgi:hypothetical protein